MKMERAVAGKEEGERHERQVTSSLALARHEFISLTPDVQSTKKVISKAERDPFCPPTALMEVLPMIL